MKNAKRLLFSFVILFLVFIVPVNVDAAQKTFEAPSVTVSNVASSGKIKLSWNRVNGAEKYQIYRSTTGKTGSFKLIKTTENTSHINNNAVVGTKYYYKVKAIFPDGSAFSKPVNSICKLPLPSFTLANDSDTGKITINWNKVKGAEKYQIYRSSTGETGSFRLLKTTTATSHTNTNAVAGTKYYYKIKAVHSNTSANSALSAYKYRTCDLARPEISLLNDEKTGKIKISWNRVNGAAKYEIYCSDDGSANSYKFLKVTTATSHQHINGVAGQKYYYKVKALHTNRDANSAMSNHRYRTCDLSAPQIKVSVDPQSKNITISWGEVKDAADYVIERAENGSSAFKKIASTKDFAYTDNTAFAGQKYLYRVRALHTESAADSAYSDVKASPEKLSPPQLTAGKNSDGKPVISWEKADGAVKYEIYRAVNKTGYYKLIFTTKNSSFTNSGACNGATYYYKVKAVGAADELSSDFSDIAAVTAGDKTETFETMYVSQLAINVYEEPITDYNTKMLVYMDEVQLGADVSSSEKGRWTRLLYDGQIYYVWIETGESKFTAQKSSFEYTSDEYCDIQNAIIETAVKWKDEPTYYTHGQSNGVIDETTGKYGFDCSGFVRYVLNSVIQEYNPMYFLTSHIDVLYGYSTLYNAGLNNQFDVIDVTYDEILPGDVIFFELDSENENNPDHCVLYLGNNEYIHAAGYTDRVHIAPLTQDRIDNTVSIRRYWPQEVKPANQTLVCVRDDAYMFEEKSEQSRIIHSFDIGEYVNIMYSSSSETWGYVQNEDGLKGYIYLSRFELKE
ncbi:MAG: C40 family peptidase [Oscillospiraceae bacterium]|nr:C40 family peptidase [Oscillospiraceae bacterium]